MGLVDTFLDGNNNCIGNLLNFADSDIWLTITRQVIDLCFQIIGQRFTNNITLVINTQNNFTTFGRIRLQISTRPLRA